MVFQVSMASSMMQAYGEVATAAEMARMLLYIGKDAQAAAASQAGAAVAA